MNGLSVIRSGHGAAVSADIGFEAAHGMVASAKEKMEPRGVNRRIYDGVYSRISDRYKEFDQAAEVGYAGKVGLTGSIEDLTPREVIAILSHIRDDDKLLSECSGNSAKSPFFDKFYLMRNSEQKWNLRLHRFNVRGSGLGGEDSPHYHRWTLASKPIQGGYVNVNYKETDISRKTVLAHQYNKYQLGATDAQTVGSARDVASLGRRAMVPVKAQVYHAGGGANHFPIEEPHSVNTFAQHFGSTVTLAHTGKSVKEESFAFEKAEMKTIPQKRYVNVEFFKARLEQEIALLQVLTLKDELIDHLREKLRRDPGGLTTYEHRHINDCTAPNYLETSLLPSLATYQLQRHENRPSYEFSASTSEFLEEKLRDIDAYALKSVIAFNQEDLYQRPENARLSVDFDFEAAYQGLQEEARSGRETQS